MCALVSERCKAESKLQRLRAIHNRGGGRVDGGRAVKPNQNYKDWEQFTTSQVSRRLRRRCKAESKLQRLRAIHNTLILVPRAHQAVKPNQNYKDWEQFTTLGAGGVAEVCCKAESKLQRLRAIHNAETADAALRGAVKPNQNYKDWEQFTTNWNATDCIYTL